VPKQVCANRPACVRLVDRGYCAECQAQGCGKDKRPSAAQRGYGYRWQGYSKSFLRGKLCVGFPLGFHGVVRVPATQTDHVTPAKGPTDPLFWDKNNHQPLCDECHPRKTATEDGGFGHAHGRSEERW
jgi:5-methylcytosine-specific restriction protein A